MSSFSQGGFFRCRLLVLSLRASLMVPDAAKWAWECDVLFNNNANRYLKVPDPGGERSSNNTNKGNHGSQR